MKDVRGLKRDIGEVLRVHAFSKMAAADASNWRRERRNKEETEVATPAGVEETSRTGIWIPGTLFRWFEDRALGFVKVAGVDVFVHANNVKGTTRSIIGALVYVKLVEDVARARGRYKALEVKRECDYIATREAVEAAEAVSARVV